MIASKLTDPDPEKDCVAKALFSFFPTFLRMAQEGIVSLQGHAAPVISLDPPRMDGKPLVSSFRRNDGFLYLAVYVRG